MIHNGSDHSSTGEWIKEMSDIEHEYDQAPGKTSWPYDNRSVDHPPHYTQGGIECIEAIEAALTPEEYRGYLKGTVFKYIWREKLKGGDESIRKAEWFLKRMYK